MDTYDLLNSLPNMKKNASKDAIDSKNGFKPPVVNPKDLPQRPMDKILDVHEEIATTVRGKEKQEHSSPINSQSVSQTQTNNSQPVKDTKNDDERDDR